MAKGYNWEAPVDVEQVDEKFTASFGERKIDLEVSYKQVKFANEAIAIDFFGSVEDMLAAAADSVNRSLEILAKSSARNFEVRVNRLTDEQVELLTEKKGPLTPEQVEKIRAKARAHIIRIDELTKNGFDTEDI